MAASYRKDNNHFKFHNENPKGKLRAQDCVIRALGFANDGYDNAFKDLFEIAFKEKDTINSDSVCEKYLAVKGWTKNKQPRKADNTKYTVTEFCKLHNTGTFVVRMAGHVSVVQDGYIRDTWDCGEYTVGNYWSR